MCTLCARTDSTVEPLSQPSLSKALTPHQCGVPTGGGPTTTLSRPSEVLCKAFALAANSTCCMPALPKRDRHFYLKSAPAMKSHTVGMLPFNWLFDASNTNNRRMLTYVGGSCPLSWLSATSSTLMFVKRVQRLGKVPLKLLPESWTTCGIKRLGGWLTVLVTSTSIERSTFSEHFL